MSFTRQRPKTPSWGTQFGRSFLELLPRLAETAGSTALRSAIDRAIANKYQQEAEAREYEREKEMLAERDRLGRERMGAQEELIRGRQKIGREARAEEERYKKGAQGLWWKPEEQAEFLGKGPEYEAQPTRIAKETFGQALPRAAGAGIGAMTGLPMFGGAAEKPPEVGAKTPWEQTAPQPTAPGGVAGGLAEMGTKAMMEAPGSKERAFSELGVTQAGAPPWVKENMKYKYRPGMTVQERLTLKAQDLYKELIVAGYKAEIAQSMVRDKLRTTPEAQMGMFDPDAIQFGDIPQPPDVPGAPRKVRRPKTGKPTGGGSPKPTYQQAYQHAMKNLGMNFMEASDYARRASE